MFPDPWNRCLPFWVESTGCARWMRPMPGITTELRCNETVTALESEMLPPL